MLRRSQQEGFWGTYPTHMWAKHFLWADLITTHLWVKHFYISWSCHHTYMIYWQNTSILSDLVTWPHILYMMYAYMSKTLSYQVICLPRIYGLNTFLSADQFTTYIWAKHFLISWSFHHTYMGETLSYQLICSPRIYEQNTFLSADLFTTHIWAKHFLISWSVHHTYMG